MHRVNITQSKQSFYIYEDLNGINKLIYNGGNNKTDQRFLKNICRKLERDGYKKTEVDNLVEYEKE